MGASKAYGRALLKISGEALGGERGHGLDPTKVSWIAAQIAQARQHGHELGVVVGGGNFLRGFRCRFYRGSVTGRRSNGNGRNMSERYCTSLGA